MVSVRVVEKKRVISVGVVVEMVLVVVSVTKQRLVLVWVVVIVFVKVIVQLALTHPANSVATKINTRIILGVIQHQQP